jgi:hypothetical protein
MAEETLIQVLDDLENKILKETDVEVYFKLGLRLVENKTMWYRSLEGAKDQKQQTAMNAYIARIAVLQEIWKDRKDLLVQKAKTEGEPSVQFNKKFRHTAQQILNPETYKNIVSKANQTK